MDCAICLLIEAELERLERDHAAKLGALRSNIGKVHADEYQRLRADVSDALMELDIARGQLEQHKRNHAKAN